MSGRYEDKKKQEKNKKNDLDRSLTAWVLWVGVLACELRVGSSPCLLTVRGRKGERERGREGGWMGVGE
jgi:hypothetical protein